ncbi:hypothetical protein IID10_19930, partial [candidate division KSB1 bacterium]|nr:hypothetical protein [candidate division KSB1 bacterium]
GVSTLISNTVGISNTAIGETALLTNTTGFRNTAVGSNADVGSGSLTNATAIGANAKVGASNSLVLGGTGANAVKVGIGTSIPTRTLDLRGRLLALEGSTNLAGGDRHVVQTDQNQSALSMVNANASFTNSVMEIGTLKSASNDFSLLRAWTGDGTNNAFTDLKFRVDGNGNVTADGTFTGGGADFAELLTVSSGASTVEAGDVMVIDPNSPRAIVMSTEPRSTLVAGIYSTKPGFMGSERDWDKPAGEEMGTYTMADMAEEFNEIPLAVLGIVPCKVSAENGAIQPGDLLVTSSLPGHAMRDDKPSVGTVLGKALGSLTSGTGVIRVLATLQ